MEQLFCPDKMLWRKLPCNIITYNVIPAAIGHLNPVEDFFFFNWAQAKFGQRFFYLIDQFIKYRIE